MNQLLEKKILICPKCASTRLSVASHKLRCLKCNAGYRMLNDQIVFDPVKLDQPEDPLGKIKFLCKKYPAFYYFLINLISPVYFSNSHLKKFLKKELKKKDLTAINLGSGNSKISTQVVNMDFIAYKNVDVVCRSERLPLKTGSVDIVINLALLEHVAQPEKIVSEIYRVLKKGGKVYCFFPFIQGFHASPYDYQRRTIEGVKELYRNFKVIELKLGEGPTSGFLWIFQEYIAILLSFGFKPLYFLLYLILMLVTFPLKFLDIALIHNQLSKNIAGGFIYVGEKE